MIFLPDAENRMIVISFFWTYDERMDRIPLAITAVGTL